MKKKLRKIKEVPTTKRILTFFELKRMNFIRCETAFHKVNSWSPTDWACAMAGEMGEACNVVKKIRRLDEADKTKDTPELRRELVQKVGDELADVIIYADLLATRLGVDLEDHVVKKFNEVSDRRGCNIKL